MTSCSILGDRSLSALLYLLLSTTWRLQGGLGAELWHREDSTGRTRIVALQDAENLPTTGTIGRAGPGRSSINLEFKGPRRDKFVVKPGPKLQRASFLAMLVGQHWNGLRRSLRPQLLL